MSEKINVHIYDNSNGPGSANCLGEFELERDKAITLHMHDGDCTLCPEGHCHYGSIAIVIGLNGDLIVTFEATRTPERITFDDFKPKRRFLHQTEEVKNDV